MGSPADKLRAKLAKGKKTAKNLKNGKKKVAAKTKVEEEQKTVENVEAKPKKEAAKKVEKPKKEAAKKGTKPKKKTAASKSNGKAHKSNGKVKKNYADRDRMGDGLRPIERKIIKVIEKDGPISLVNVAKKVFRAKEIPGEGPDSVRTIRNGIRKPVEYGMLEWTDRGIMDLTRYAKKHGINKAVSRYQKQAMNAAKEAAGAGETPKSKSNGAPKRKKTTRKKSKKVEQQASA